MLFKILGIAIILGVLFLAVSLAVFYYDSNKQMKNRQPITKIEINSITISHEVFTTNNLHENKITIVNVWGTYCDFCVKEMPDLQSVFEEYKDDGIGVLGIVIDLFTAEPHEKNLFTAKKILQENSITYPNIYLDKDLKAYLSNKVFLVPTTFIVDSSGYLVGEVIENVCTKQRLEEILSQIKEQF